jgi:hypothetical protein
MTQSLDRLNYADRLLLARTIRDYYQRDQSDFQAYNAVRFTAQWDSDWQASILAAEIYITDEDILDQSTSIAQQVDTLLADSRKLYQRFIKPFIEDAFPNDMGMRNQFGLDDYADYNRTANKMMIFLQKLYVQCTAYQAVLTVAGINPAKIAEINTLYNALNTASLAQSTFIGKRMTSAQTRQNLFAQMDEFTAQTCRAGKNIYIDEDMAKYRCYLLPNRTSSTPNAVETLPANAKIEVVQSVVLGDYFEITNKGTNAFTLYIAESTQGAVPTTAVVLAANQNATYAAVDLGFDENNPAAQMLIFWNNNAADAKYTLEKLG